MQKLQFVIPDLDFSTTMARATKEARIHNVFFCFLWAVGCFVLGSIDLLPICFIQALNIQTHHCGESGSFKTK